MAIAATNTIGAAPTDPVSKPRVTTSQRLIVAIVCLPIVLAMLRAVSGNWQPVGDNGILGVRMLDVGTEHHPLLGSWSSASTALGTNVNHPGPWYSYLSAPFVRLFGPRAGIPLAVGTINILAVVGISMSARRLGGASLERWMLAAAAALIWSVGSELLVDPWQPHAVLLATLLLFVLAGGLATGDVAFLAPTAVVSSVIVQTHLGSAYFLGLVCAGAAVSALIVRRPDWSPLTRRGLRRAARSRWFVSAVVGSFIAWLPAIVDQGIGQQNLSRLATNVGRGQLRLGYESSLQIVSTTTSIPPFWSRGHFAEPFTATFERAGNELRFELGGLPSTTVASVSTLTLLMVLTLCWRVTRKRGTPAERGMLSISIVGVFAALFAAANLIIGTVGVAAHHLRWIFPLGVFCHATIGWVGFSWLSTRLHRPRLEPVVAIVGAVGFSMMSIPAFAHDTGPVGASWAREPLSDVRHQLRGLDLPQPLYYEFNSARPFGPYSGAMLLYLAELGVEYTVDDQTGYQVGRRRDADRPEVGTLYERDGANAILYKGQDCVIASTDALDDDERERVMGVVREIADRFLDGTAEVAAEMLSDDPKHLEFLDAASSDDRERVTWHVLDGTLVPWTATGALDPATSSLIAGSWTDIEEFSRSSFLLLLRTDGPCPVATP